MTKDQIKIKAVALYYKLREWGFDHSMALSVTIEFVFDMTAVPYAPPRKARIKNSRKNSL